MSEFDYKKWLREQKDSLDPEEMPEKPEGDLDGDGEVSQEEIDIKKQFESELAKLIKGPLKQKKQHLNPKIFAQSIRDVRNSIYYSSFQKDFNEYDKSRRVLEDFLELVMKNYIGKYIVSQNQDADVRELIFDYGELFDTNPQFNSLMKAYEQYKEDFEDQLKWDDKRIEFEIPFDVDEL